MIRLPNWFVIALALVVLVGLAMPVLAADLTKGKIKSVSADKKEFVLTDNDNKEWTFQLDAAGKVRMSDKDIQLQDLKAGDPVQVTYDKQGDKFIAKEVTCERK